MIESIRTEQQFLRGYDRSAILGMAFTTLIAAVVSLKHEGFAEEAEWRAIYSPARTPSRFICSDTVVIDGVPQVIYKLPFDKTVSPEIVPLDIASVLDRVIIGPTQYAGAMKQAFRLGIARRRHNRRRGSRGRVRHSNTHLGTCHALGPSLLHFSTS